MSRTLLLSLALCLLALTGRAAEDAAPAISAGINLAPVRDWSTEQPFIDVMKTARRWIGHKPRQWGGVSYQELEARGVLDENGWPMEMPPDLASIGTVILTDLPAEAQSYAGRYVLRFEGEGIVEVAGAARNVRYGAHRVAFDFSPGGMVVIKIQRTDPRHTGAYVRNISVVKQDNLEAWRRGEIFNPDWIARIEGFAAVRFMDWMRTNDSTQARWQDRPRVDDFSYTRRGVPVEVMIALANRLGSAPWFNIPHQSDDAYSRAFARLVAERLDPALKVYVEYSNEVWNWQFDQADWAEARAQARWHRKNRWMEYYGVRAAQVARIWSEVFTDQRARLVTVFATQTGWPGLEKSALEAPLWVAEDPEHNEPPYRSFDAYAVAPYFGQPLGSDKRRDLVRGWIAQSRDKAEAQARARGLEGADFDSFVARHRFDAATALAARELRDGAISGKREGSLADLLERLLPHHAEVAARYGLRLIAYEGGAHVAGSGAQVDDDALTGFFIHLNYSEEMARLYERLISGWAGIKGGPLMFYSDVAKPTKWGSWGHLRHLGDDNPRWRAIARLRAGHGD